MSKLYTEEQVRKAWNTAYVDALALDNKYYKPIFYDDFIASLTPIELPTDEEIDNASLKQFPYPTDIKDKNDMIIKTTGLKPFNHAKIEKYRTAYIIGAIWMRDKIKGGVDE